MTPHVGTATPTALVGIRWDHPDLGEWDVRAFVGHTSRVFLAIETYLSKPAAAVEVSTATDYFRAARALGGGVAIAERGSAGAALGEDPAPAVVDIAERVPAIVGSADPEALLTTAVGGLRLADHLPPHTFELVVHTSDLAAALGAPLDIPATAAAQALEIVAGLAIADGLAGTLRLASTGRSDLPMGSTCLGFESWPQQSRRRRPPPAEIPGTRFADRGLRSPNHDESHLMRRRGQPGSLDLRRWDPMRGRRP